MPRPTALVVAFLALALALPGLAQEGAPPAPTVQVAAAYTDDIVQAITFVGRAEAIDQVGLVARVGGFLQEVKVRDGGEVIAGEVLFQIEPDAYRAAVAAREADLASARASLDLAMVELGRTQELVSRGSSPQSDLDVARATRATAEAAVKAADAALTQAELDLGYTTITAPFDGRIGRIARSVGDLVGPDAGPLVTLVREAPIYVEFALSERQMVEVMQQANRDGRRGAGPAVSPDVYVTLPDGSELEEIGQIAFADNRVDPATGTVAVRARFANAARLIVDGAFLSVRIEAAEPVERLLIPQAALQRDQKGDFVLTVNAQGMVEQRYVILGDQAGTAMIVDDGLLEGEQVITEGLQRVRPGVPVDAVLAASPAE
jgi:RND family efflux transporter MFP subunit